MTGADDQKVSYMVHVPLSPGSLEHFGVEAQSRLSSAVISVQVDDCEAESCEVWPVGLMLSMSGSILISQMVL
eukprot:scaffold5878_cov108-Skeletonema_dohrnii-CCMP3373.AAC.4